MAKLTQKGVGQQLRLLGFTLGVDRDVGEFIVKLRGESNDDPSAYHTDNLRDALNTARSIARERAPWDSRITPPLSTDPHMFRASYEAAWLQTCTICGEVRSHRVHLQGAQAAERSYDPALDADPFAAAPILPATNLPPRPRSAAIEWTVAADAAIGEACEMDGSVHTHYADVLESIWCRLNSWHSDAAPPGTLIASLHTQLMNKLREAGELAAQLDHEVDNGIID